MYQSSLRVRPACAVQVLYNAQMIRTWSLLLRNAQRLGYVVNGRQVHACRNPHVFFQA